MKEINYHISKLEAYEVYSLLKKKFNLKSHKSDLTIDQAKKCLTDQKFFEVTSSKIFKIFNETLTPEEFNSLDGKIKKFYETHKDEFHEDFKRIQELSRID
jgi:hypothetical protein